MAYDWTVKSEALADMVDTYYWAWNRYVQANNHWTWALEWYDAGNDHAALGEVIQAARQLTYGIGELASYNVAYTPPTLIPYYFTYHADVTYQSIVEAWAANDFEGRAVTIAFIDRMRQLIWSEPYFVAWAAKPEEQEL